MRAIRRNTLTFGVGPAGTGKTYLAIAMAVAALKSKEVERIVLTRPAVEAGEKLGFLPGDLSAEGRSLPAPAVRRAVRNARRGGLPAHAWSAALMEVAPLAYMRGRTLDDAFIILDEAQNTTSEQMKMFLTRMGMGSKHGHHRATSRRSTCRAGKRSGLIEALEVLKGVEDIGIVQR